MSFLGEAKRRKVFQVAAVYAVVAWLLVQIIVAVEDPLNLPGWFDTAVIVLLAIGFPITLIMSWAFNLTPEGLIADKGELAGSSGGRRIEFILIGLLVVALGWIGYRELGPSGDTNAQRLPNSVAVLPFGNLSPDVDDEYFALGMHQEINDQLRKLSGLTVISRTTMMRFADSPKSIREIADELGVDAVMEGSLRYADNNVQVSVQLIDPGTDTDLWSATYDADMHEVSNIFAAQRNIATNVAGALEARMSLEEQRRLGRTPTASGEAYEFYLEGLAAAGGATGPDGSERAREAFIAAINEDASFALAWAKLSYALTIAPTWEPDRTVELQDRAYATALRALELEPDLPEAHIAMSFVSTVRGDWIRAAEEYRLSIELGANPDEMPEWSVLELSVGHIDQARSTLAANQVVNPLNSTGLAFLLAANEALGDSAAMRAGYEQGRTFEENWYFGESIMNVIRLGRRELEALVGDDGAIPSLHTRFGDYDSTAAAVDALRSWHASDESNNHNSKFAIAAWAAFYGDNDLALDAAADSSKDRVQNIWFLWLPVFDEVRQTDGFRRLVEERGLVAYWEMFGWPDFCSPTEGTEFECS